MDYLQAPSVDTQRHRSLLPVATLSSNHPCTQKEEMLAGRHYFPFDKELVLERERCSAACWRFNNCNDPNNSVSPEEQLRLFRDILHPRDLVVSASEASEASPLAPVGRVGDNVIVKAPFSCDYGYNITIGQDVAIRKNWTNLGSCDVVIGDRCNIGPNVRLKCSRRLIFTLRVSKTLQNSTPKTQ